MISNGTRLVSAASQHKQARIDSSHGIPEITSFSLHMRRTKLMVRELTICTVQFLGILSVSKQRVVAVQNAEFTENSSEKTGFDLQVTYTRSSAPPLRLASR